MLGTAVQHLDRGIAALNAALLHLSNRWEAGGIYTFPCPPQRLSLLPQRFRPMKISIAHLLSPPLVPFTLSNFPFDFPINP